MNIISPDFRGELQAAVEAALEAVLPWGMPHPTTVRITPKVHQIDWYTAGFI